MLVTAATGSNWCVAAQFHVLPFLRRLLIVSRASGWRAETHSPLWPSIRHGIRSGFESSAALRPRLVSRDAQRSIPRAIDPQGKPHGNDGSILDAVADSNR